MSFELSGLYAITDRKLIPKNRFTQTVEAAIKGGVKIVQLREKDDREIAAENEIVAKGKSLLKITRRYKVPLIINDSPEIARKIGADGVHLGKDDAQISEARKILGEKSIIGISCGGEIERGINAEKSGANYAAFGTPYFTPTKPERKPTPLATIAEAKLKLKIPIFAIGGINPENSAEVLQTGADGIAVITAIFGEKDTERSAKNLAKFFRR